jgi:nitrite reductase (NO-forming)
MTLTQRKTTMVISSAIAAIIIMSVITPGVNLFNPTQIGQTNSLSISSYAKPVTANANKDSFSGLSVVGGLVPITLQQAYASGAPIKQMTLVAVEKTIALPSALSGVHTPTQVVAYTFNGTIPGPTIRVKQGDIVNATIIVPATNTDNHSIDNHAAVTSATNFVSWIPSPDLGHAKSYLFMAVAPGLFEYHCEGNVNDLPEHVFRGMQGGVIVDPSSGYSGYTMVNGTYQGANTISVSADAKDIFLDFSEYYLTDPGLNGLSNGGNFDWKKMFSHDDTFSYINGIPFGYQILPNAAFPASSGAPLPNPANAVPLHFKVGDHVRFFVLNIGDFLTNFHIVGEQLDKVTQGGAQQTGIQTFNIGGSNSAIIDVTFTQPGIYVIVNHEYSQLAKGQFAAILVDGSGGTNPSNAVPPTGINSISQTTTPYSFGTPLPSNCLVSTGSNSWTISPSCNAQIPVVNGGAVDTTN